MTGTTSRPDAASQDFAAALHEIESNVEVRRLMIVVLHVLVPTMAMAVVSAATGVDYPPQLAWVPHHVLWIVGTVLLVGSLITGVILSRCHFGMVVNGTKMAKVVRGTFVPTRINWLGVTTNFLAINALTAAGGAALIGLATGLVWTGIAGGVVVGGLLLLVIRIQHERANRLCAELHANWQHGEVSAELREQHLRKSLDATSADVSIVVTMAAALFAGTFDAMANLGSLAPEVQPGADLDALKPVAVAGLALFTLLSLLLSARIVVRLRIALAEHSAHLAELRSEADRPWRFHPFERTFLLFLLVMAFASSMALIGGWTLAGPLPGGVVAVALGLAGVIWYPAMLRSAAPRSESESGAVPSRGAGREPETWWRRGASRDD